MQKDIPNKEMKVNRIAKICDEWILESITHKFPEESMTILNAFVIFNLDKLSVDLSSNEFKCFGFHEAKIVANH